MNWVDLIAGLFIVVGLVLFGIGLWRIFRG